MKYTITLASSNRKTGPIPTTYTARESCPPSCPQYRGACYAEDFFTRMVWNRTTTKGMNLDALVRVIESLPMGQLWRHNVAGDLPGEGETVDAYQLGRIVQANRGRRGFTYTHKKTADAIKWARFATQWGFTVNLSADDAGEADRLAEHGLPVTCIVPQNTPKHSKTPRGRDILICPAQTVDYMTCALCGLCQRADRRQIVGFRAHGTRARTADARARRVIPITKG